MAKKIVNSMVLVELLARRGSTERRGALGCAIVPIAGAEPSLVQEVMINFGRPQSLLAQVSRTLPKCSTLALDYLAA